MVRRERLSRFEISTQRKHKEGGETTSHQRALLQGLLFCPLEFSSHLSMHSELHLWCFLCCEQEGAILVCPACLRQHSPVN